jgi:hypothetical protein
MISIYFLVKEKNMELVLNIYGKERDKETGKREIVKTYKTDEYDLMYGTVEDILTIFDVENMNDTNEILKMVMKTMNQLKPLLKDVFYGLSDEELKCIKVKELIPVVVGILKIAMEQFSDGSKNVMRG